jgi:hypothetical protein
MFDAVIGACVEQSFIGSLPWTQCMPLSEGAPIRHGCEHWRAAGKPVGAQIVIPRSLWYKHRQVRPGLGNHTAMLGAQALEARVIGQLAHFPLRSVEQMQRKIVLGCLSFLARGDDAASGRHHWFDAMRRLAIEGLDEADMFGMAASYSERDAAYRRLPAAEIPHCGFTKAYLSVAHETLNVDINVPAIEPWEAVAAAIADWRPQATRLLAPRDARVILKDNVIAVQHGS